MGSKVMFIFWILSVAMNVWSQNSPDFGTNREETVRNLQSLIRIDTSNPPGNETKVVEFIKAILDKEGIASEVFFNDRNRANLVARIKGNGTKRPLLLLGHTDVVGVEREKWTVDPFAGLIKDGYVWGRGAGDDKDNVAVTLQIMLMLQRQKTPLDRDVIALWESGEEGTTSVGIEFMVNEHWDKIDSEFAILEGGGINVVDGKVQFVGVATTEKVPHTTTLIARGTSGHGSMPRTDNPIVHLAAAVARLGQYQPPMRLNETTRAYFQRLATVSSAEDAFLYTHIEDPALGAMVQEQLRKTKISQNSNLRTSISPNIIKGGFRSNVIPGDAEATLDIRALPDEDMTEFFASIRRIVDNPAIEVIPPKTPGRPKAAPSSLETELFRALERAQARVFPDAITIPSMLNGATDGAYLRAKGVHAYGIGSYVDGDSLAHGNDEKVSMEGVGKFLEFMYHAVIDVAATKS